MRDQLRSVLETSFFRTTVLVLIGLNALVLTLDTIPSISASPIGPVLSYSDRALLGMFLGEILARILAYGPRFFRSPWNLFDTAVVLVSLVPASSSLSILRSLRVLRLLRLVSCLPSLRRVVDGFLRALPGMGSVFGLLSLLYLIGAVLATNLFGSSFPAWFGDVGRSAYSLFQIMTLESWSMGIVRPVMEVYPLAWAFFVPFILLTTFAVMNLLVGLVVASMQEAHDEKAEAATDKHRDEVLERLRKIEELLSNR